MKRQLGMWMMSIVLAVVLAGCGGASIGATRTDPVLADSAGSDADQRAYTINVNGSGVVSAAPDVADIRLGVETVAADAEEAIADNTERMNQVMEAIMALGVEETDIQTVDYNMWVEDVRNDEGLPTNEIRYHVVNQIRVHLRDLTKAGALLEDALAAGANTVSGISFSVDDVTELQAEARENAIANAREKAEALAAGLGVQVGDVRQVSEYSSAPRPEPVAARMEGLGGGGEIPVSGGAFQVTVEVQVVFDIDR